MIWQDWVFLIGSFVFAFTLVPTIYDPESSVPRYTSVPTAGTLLVFSATFLTLGLYLSAAGNLFTAVAWVGIALWRAPRRTDGDGPETDGESGTPRQL